MRTLLYLCFLGLSRSKTSAMVAERSSIVAHDDEWWRLSPPRNPEQGTGEGVSVFAYIFYDSEFAKAEKTRKKPPTSNDENVGDTAENYFQGAFEQVQVYFRNQSININVKIKKVVEKSDWLENTGDIYDARRVLQKLTSYGKSLHQPANTIFYLFTWGSRKFLGSETTKPGSLGVSAIETYNTFCSKNTSGAVIRQHPGSKVPWSTIKATSYMLGSKSFIEFTRGDGETMNKTLAKCPKVDPNMPGC